jgi:hypothetical protein
MQFSLWTKQSSKAIQDISFNQTLYFYTTINCTIIFHNRNFVQNIHADASQALLRCYWKAKEQAISDDSMNRADYTDAQPNTVFRLH